MDASTENVGGIHQEQGLFSGSPDPFGTLSPRWLNDPGLPHCMLSGVRQNFFKGLFLKKLSV